MELIQLYPLDFPFSLNQNLLNFSSIRMILSSHPFRPVKKIAFFFRYGVNRVIIIT